jgi:hypothetical protein
MGWGRMLLLGDLGQQLDIRDTQESLQLIKRHLQEANRFDQDVARSLGELSRENMELKLYLAAIVRLLVAKGAVTPAELAAVVDAIDRSDGQADGAWSGKIPPAG